MALGRETGRPSSCIRMRENRVEERLREYVKRRGGLCLKWVCPGHAGVPDRIILLPGARIIFLELKAPGKKPTTLQSWWLAKLKSLGFQAEWTDNAEDWIERMEAME